MPRMQAKKNDQIHRVKNFLDNLIPRSPFKKCQKFHQYCTDKKSENLINSTINQKLNQ